MLQLIGNAPHRMSLGGLGAPPECFSSYPYHSKISGPRGQAFEAARVRQPSQAALQAAAFRGAGGASG